MFGFVAARPHPALMTILIHLLQSQMPITLSSPVRCTMAMHNAHYSMALSTNFAPRNR